VFIEDNSGITGIGECSFLPRLSIDDRPDYEEKLTSVCNSYQQQGISDYGSLLKFFDEQLAVGWPSIRMGIETAFLDRMNGGGRIVFHNDFIDGAPIPINGLIWMGEKRFMLEQVKEKVESGFRCIKVKIGAIDFDAELDVLKYVRSNFTEQDITLRVDANGAFNMKNVMEKLKLLERLKIHSIEQPIEAGQWESMRKLCERSPIPIGLDEELIGAYSCSQKKEMIEFIKPHFIILKPSLLGGFKASDGWIQLARSNKAGWWITSALESNIGLNAICQYTFGLGVEMEQGLGTGALYRNNIESPLVVKNGNIEYTKGQSWDLSGLQV
jgi:L-alanine-DL-glutamate epimerase-like enolase superfamily enzyme